MLNSLTKESVTTVKTNDNYYNWTVDMTRTFILPVNLTE